MYSRLLYLLTISLLPILALGQVRQPAKRNTRIVRDSFKAMPKTQANSMDADATVERNKPVFRALVRTGVLGGSYLEVRIGVAIQETGEYRISLKSANPVQTQSGEFEGLFYPGDTVIRVPILSKRYPAWQWFNQEWRVAGEPISFDYSFYKAGKILDAARISLAVNELVDADGRSCIESNRDIYVHKNRIWIQPVYLEGMSRASPLTLNLLEKLHANTWILKPKELSNLKSNKPVLKVLDCRFDTNTRDLIRTFGDPLIAGVWVADTNSRTAMLAEKMGLSVFGKEFFSTDCETCTGLTSWQMKADVMHYLFFNQSNQQSDSPIWCVPFLPSAKRPLASMLNSVGLPTHYYYAFRELVPDRLLIGDYQSGILSTYVWNKTDQSIASTFRYAWVDKDGFARQVKAIDFQSKPQSYKRLQQIMPEAVVASLPKKIQADLYFRGSWLDGSKTISEAVWVPRSLSSLGRWSCHLDAQKRIINVYSALPLSRARLSTPKGIIPLNDEIDLQAFGTKKVEFIGNQIDTRLSMGKTASVKLVVP